jgi:hypothetical protein
MCSPVVGGGDYCVIAATDIVINLLFRATGSRPLVLIASGSITTKSNIDVGSHRGATPEVGAGADAPACYDGILPQGSITSGGGAGGSFAGLGGGGGMSSVGATGGSASATAANITELRGGCRGQDGAGVLTALGGHSGGAVALIAGDQITLRAGIIATGEGGAGGVGQVSGGGGGGGSGGMIVLDAPSITSNSKILASGGGGGEGSDAGDGAPGGDANSTSPAVGGDGNGNGGGGGSGSDQVIAAPGMPGNPGTSGTSSSGGGGGGGGGAGLIRAPGNANLGPNVSPPVTPSLKGETANATTMCAMPCANGGRRACGPRPAWPRRGCRPRGGGRCRTRAGRRRRRAPSGP